MKTIVELLESISEPLKKQACLSIYQKYRVQFDTKPASVKHHHTKSGDFGRHLMEVMNLAIYFYDLNPEWYDCTKDEVIICAFVHDLDKIDRYIDSEPWRQQAKYGGQMFDYNKKKIKMAEAAETVARCGLHGLTLNEKMVNAISFHHGGWVEPKISVMDMTPLAVLIHMSDVLSCKIYS